MNVSLQSDLFSFGLRRRQTRGCLPRPSPRAALAPCSGKGRGVGYGGTTGTFFGRQPQRLTPYKREEGPVRFPFVRRHTSPLPPLGSHRARPSPRGNPSAPVTPPGSRAGSGGGAAPAPQARSTPTAPPRLVPTRPGSSTKPGAGFAWRRRGRGAGPASLPQGSGAGVFTGDGGGVDGVKGHGVELEARTRKGPLKDPPVPGRSRSRSGAGLIPRPGTRGPSGTAPPGSRAHVSGSPPCPVFGTGGRQVVFGTAGTRQNRVRSQAGHKSPL